MKRLLLAFALLAATGAHALDGPRRVIINGNVPNWVTQNWGSLAPLISWDYDFQRNRCYIQGAGQVSCDSILSTSRASNEICAQNNGTLISVGSNTRCWTDQGLLIQEARTNKSTNYNANPPALVTPTDAATFNAAVTNLTATGGDGNTLWGVVDDSAEIASAGLSGVTNSRVISVDNTAGAVTAVLLFSGQTGNTNAHSISFYARMLAGTGSIRLNAGEGNSNFTNSTYQRKLSENVTPGDTTRVLAFAVAAGANGRVILNQLEEGAFATSPIVIAGSSATRAADVISLTGQSATDALAAKAAFFQTNGVAGGATPYLFKFNSGAAQQIRYSSTTAAQIYNGITTVSGTFGSGDTAGLVKSAYSMDTSSFSAVANGGTLASSATSFGSRVGSITLGNIAVGTGALNGYMQRSTGSAFKGLFDNSTRLQ